MSNPDDLERDLGKTRESLSADVARLNDKAAPSKIVGARLDSLKRSANSMKDRVMGAADSGEAKDKAGDAVGAARDKADALATKVSDAAGGAPDAVRDQATGNPLAAGVIAFGIGWLLSSLAPATSAEQDAAKRLEDNAGGVLDPLKQSAQQVKDDLQQPVQDSIDQLRSTATDAATKTADHAKSASQDIQAPLQQ